MLFIIYHTCRSLSILYNVYVESKDYHRISGDERMQGTTEEALRILAHIVAKAYLKKREPKTRNNQLEEGKARNHKKKT